MKNSTPIMRMEIVVSFFVNERMSTEAVSVLLMKQKIFLCGHHSILLPTDSPFATAFVVHRDSKPTGRQGAAKSTKE
jgi:hypothetical protein